MVNFVGINFNDYYLNIKLKFEKENDLFYWFLVFLEVCIYFKINLEYDYKKEFYLN